MIALVATVSLLTGVVCTLEVQKIRTRRMMDNIFVGRVLKHLAEEVRKGEVK